MIRLMNIEDYNQLIGFWKSIDGMGLRSLDDSQEGIARFLIRNPTTCFVAVQDDKLIGCILAGHDGRRGYIYHAAVDKLFRGKGYGKMLTDKVLSALKEEGIHKAALVVFKTNDIGNEFWEKYGFEIRDDLNYRNISINSENF